MTFYTMYVLNRSKLAEIWLHCMYRQSFPAADFGNCNVYQN